MPAASPEFALYTYFRSSAAYRVRIALNLKGLKAEHRFVSLVRHEHTESNYRALNPQGVVPTLVQDGRALGQSLAIIEYLEEIAPTPPLLPADPFERARVRQMALAIACEIHPVCNLRIREYLRDTLKLPDAEQAAWQTHWIGLGLAAVEEMAGDGRFCHGDAPTLADVCLIPQLYNARRAALDLSPYPKLLRIEKAANALAAFRDAAPENQPDAPPRS